MPIPVTCTCGKRVAAKDEFAGKRLKCPSCGGAIAIPASQAAAPQPAAPAQADPLFASDPFAASASSGNAFDLGNLSGFDAPGPASAPFDSGAGPFASSAPSLFPSAGY